VFVAVSGGLAVAQVPSGLKLTGQDVRVVPQDDGYHLIIRQTPGLASVMLTEAFELPNHKLATYSWRSLKPNPVNGAEKRLLNGKELPQPNLFLISSTVISDPYFGPSFEILVPPIMEYGSKDQPNSRYGQVDVTATLGRGEKVWFSIRTFAKPYEDYTGPYQDNAFEFSTIVITQALPHDGSYYVKGNEDLFRRLGTINKARDAADGVQFLKTLFADNVDLVVCLDLTKSMGKDLAALKTDLLPGLADTVAGLTNFRLGLVEYRDYGETLITRPFALSPDPKVWIREVSASEAMGGGDIPEAVIEAMDAGLSLFDKEPKEGIKRVLVIFGDAPQHDSPRGKIKESDVVARAAALDVDVRPVLLPVTPF
jgi:hypothetical protein